MLAVVAACYWPGLTGPLLFDDFGNLSNVTAWLDGDRTLWSVITQNRSGPGGRPIAMATFVLDAALWGKDVWHFKLTNLVVHLMCGAMVLLMLGRMIGRDPALAIHARWLPLFLAFIWMALPINASSVLYVVQRMAMLSALFMFAGTWAYIVSREAIERGDRRGYLGMFLAVPALTAVAFFSKENGLLLPALALAVELAFFQPARGAKRPQAIRWFLAFAIVAPIIGLAAVLTFRPGMLLEAYAMRDFTLLERLLTQPRILWDYVATIFVPFGPQLGLFHDNYPKSTGLLSPLTTLPAILGWLLLLGLAWRARARHPAILGGLLFFLAGHAMESSILGLELYFEHRNYLPSAGLLVASAGAVVAGLQRLGHPSRAFQVAFALSLAIAPIVYLTATHGRARVWSSNDTLFAQELAHNPNSPRLRSFLTGFAIEAGSLDEALAHIDAGERNSPASMAMTTSLWRAVAYCGTGNLPTDAVYAELEARAHGRIERFAMNAWELLASRIESGSCPGIDVARLTDMADVWLRDPRLAATSQQVWRTRYYLARLLAHQSKFEEAVENADIAWKDSAYNDGIGVFLFQVNASLGNRARCAEIYQRLARARGGDVRLNRAIDTFGEALRDGTI